MTHTTLQVVGHIDIPAGVMAHRFVREATANSMMLAKKADPRMQVVGTENTRRCELYGWAPNVDSHRDCTGWVYLVALDEGTSHVHAWASAKPSSLKLHSVDLVRGAVVRLWDFCEHWTEDKAARVAAFVGSYEHPQDADAIASLRNGIQALERGDYYGAPRVRDGFRALQPDECLAANAAFDGLEPMLIEDARAQRRLIERCGLCRKPAVRPDNHWPYFNEGSRCRKHLGRPAPSTPTSEESEP